MKNYFKLAAFTLLSAACLTGCDDSTDSPTPSPVTPTVRVNEGMYVINQGSMGTIDGSISFVSFDSTAVNTTTDVFRSANNQSLGDSPQKAIIYGSKMYVPVYGANTLWVLDAQTLKIIKQVQTNQPEGVCATDGYVFVSNNDGYVTRVDTTSYAASTPLAVGPNPAELCATGGKVYVSISDGYNYQNNYADGFKVAVIDAATFTHVNDIAVGMNPGGIAADVQGNVFVVCRGNYSDVASKVWRIDATAQTAATFADGSLVATNPSAHTACVYILNSVTDYSNWPDVSTSVTGSIYDSTTGIATVSNFIPADNAPAYPTAIDINPWNGQIYISTQATASGYTDPGYVMVFNSNGKFLTQYATGVEPFGVVFK